MNRNHWLLVEVRAVLATIAVLASAILVAGALVSLAGCGTGQLVPVQAQQGGGLLSPTPSQINSGKAYVDSAPALTQAITQCPGNAQAQVDYNWLAGFCGNAPNFQLPSAPLSITTSLGTQMTAQAKAAWCQANMWTGPSGQLAIPVTSDASHTPVIPVLGPPTCPSAVTTSVAAPAVSMETPAK